MAMISLNIFQIILKCITVGIFSTLFMDIVNILGKILRVHGGGSYALIGRWICGFFKGKFAYSNILEEPACSCEVPIGLISHYCIGVGLSFVYVMLSYLLQLQASSYGWALAFGFLTNVLPWFIMFPAFGFGILAFNGPPRSQLLLVSTLNHLGYGLALGLSINFWMSLPSISF